MKAGVEYLARLSKNFSSYTRLFQKSNYSVYK